MERYCGCFDNKYEFGFTLLVVLFMSVLFYNDSRTQIVNGRQNKRQSNKYNSTSHNEKNKQSYRSPSHNQKNKQSYRSPRGTGSWRNNSVALFGMSLDEWNNMSRDVTLACNVTVAAPAEQKA